MRPITPEEVTDGESYGTPKGSGKRTSVDIKIDIQMENETVRVIFEVVTKCVSQSM